MEQWTPSNPATLGTSQSVLIRGVASFQGVELYYTMDPSIQWSLTCTYTHTNTHTNVHITHHVHLVVVLQNPDTEQEGEEQLVLLKERAADVAVQTEGKVLIDAGYPLLKVV